MTQGCLNSVLGKNEKKKSIIKPVWGRRGYTRQTVFYIYFKVNHLKYRFLCLILHRKYKIIFVKKIKILIQINNNYGKNQRLEFSAQYRYHGAY